MANVATLPKLKLVTCPKCSSVYRAAKVSNTIVQIACFPLTLRCLTGECDVGGRRGLLRVAGNHKAHRSHLMVSRTQD